MGLHVLRMYQSMFTHLFYIRPYSDELWGFAYNNVYEANGMLD